MLCMYIMCLVQTNPTDIAKRMAELEKENAQVKTSESLDALS